MRRRASGSYQIDHDTAMGLKIIAYDLIVISNMEAGDKLGEIMKIVSC